MITFWGLVAVLAAVVLGVIVVEIWERVKEKRNARDAAMSNQYLQERERQNAADRLLTALYPTTRGPHGFRSQNDRRPTEKKEHEKNDFARVGTTDGPKQSLTASKRGVN